MISEIIVLTEVEAVRKNPGMYIGSVCEIGAHQLLQELVHNAVDESVLGTCKNIQVTFSKDFCSVEDDGRGIPTEIHSEEGVSCCEVVLTKLHSGSKFNKKPGHFTAGLHGVGLSCVNALSSNLAIAIYQHELTFVQEYKEGKPLQPLRKTERTTRTGTKISFWPDKKIFTTFKKFNEEKSISFLETLSYLHPGVVFSLEIKDENKKYSYQSNDGILGLFKLTTNKFIFKKPIDIQLEEAHLRIEALLCWTTDTQPHIRSFVNSVDTINGGTHVNAVKVGITRALNKLLSELGQSTWKGSPIEVDEASEGIFAIINCKLTNPNFEGQTKGRLTNSEIIEPIEHATYKQTVDFLKNNPKITTLIFERIHEVRNARLAAKRVAERIYFQQRDKGINEEVYKEQFGARSKNWHDSAVWITHKELLDSHASLFNENKEAIALDVCCGSGVVGASFKHKVKKVIGLDLTPEMVNLAKHRLDEVKQGNVYKIPFPDNSFDLVCTREVLHLLPYPEKPVSEIFRVLKPGAQFIVGQILPFGEDDGAWMYRVFKKKQPLIFNMFQEEDFRKLLTGAGFVNLEMKEMNVWESIDVWINSYETTQIHQHEIRELFKNAPTEAKAIHPFRILPSGEIQDLWRWCVFSVKKPG